MILAEVISPNSLKASFSFSSVVSSPKFLTYRLTPSYFFLTLHFELLEAFTEFLLALLSFLSAGDVQGLGSTVNLVFVEHFNSFLSFFNSLEIDETETFGFALGIRSNFEAGDLASLGEQLLNLVLVYVFGNVLHVHVSEASSVANSAFLLGFEGLNADFLAGNHLAVNTLDGALGSLFTLVMDKAISKRLAFAVNTHLAGKNVAKHRESVVQTLVVNGFCQIFHKDVALARSAQGRVSVRPHDAAGAVADVLEIHGVQSTFSIFHAVEVDVGIAERTAAGSVTADTNRGNGSDGVENFKEKSFSYVVVEIADVQRGRSVGSRNSHVFFLSFFFFF
mmetsp:Transcript_23249/g.32848  ORF Transcript_23249/g.32848 Transcript_23249/m.32848 type:complete len:336 (-) Transcript_23249:11-1018(-)